MRDAIASAKALYELTAIQLKDEGAKEVVRQHNFSQTSPWLKNHLGDKKKRNADEVETPNPKRRPQSSAKVVDSMGKQIPKVAAVEDTPNANGEKGAWSTVVNKKTAKNAKRKAAKAETKVRKTRPDAIIIKATGDTSYADMLRKVKSDPKLEEIGKSITRIRKTQKGELLFQLSETGDKSAEFTKKISETLGQQAAVTTMTSRTTIEIKNVDEVTLKEDVVEKIKEQFDVEVSHLDIYMRKAYGDMQIASINLPDAIAKKMLEVGKIKIGWSNCHIRIKPKEMTKCFRCLEFGHIAKLCKSQDRSRLCRRCGMEGHIAKDCKKDPSCMFCKQDNANDVKHVAGSNSCLYFRRALSKRL